MLVVVCGVPGVGKTSVANHLAERLDAPMYRTDVVRKQLVEDPQYTDEERVMVYEELLGRAEDSLAATGDAVVDGTFHDRTLREAARSTADRAGADVRFVKIECDERVAKRRIREREDDESDADVEIHVKFRDQFEPLEVDHVTVDNSGSLAATREQVDERVVQTAPGVGN
jgi:predicted kinase